MERRAPLVLAALPLALAACVFGNARSVDVDDDGGKTRSKAPPKITTRP